MTCDKMCAISDLPITEGGGRKIRSSNLELYRIICMLMIIAHHFVVNSGLTLPEGPMMSNPTDVNTLFLYLFGIWGKTGINCFLLITGYFMCKSNISLKKFVKLLLWIYLYKIVIYGIFFVTGYESFSAVRLFKLIMPVWGFQTNFTSCFIGFWLTIPFWNILIHNMTKQQHKLLILLLLGMYTILGTIPMFGVAMNYVTWFGIIYLIASFIRLYPTKLMNDTRFWGWMSLITILFASLSAIVMQYVIHKGAGFFVSDSNKFFAVVVAVSTFLWFKNLNIPNSKVINAVGGSTFGVLLIHANSDAMRQWLWKDTVDCVGHYELPLMQLIFFSVGVVLLVFFTCILIDRIRIRFIEKPFFRWYDKEPRFQKLTNLLIQE